MNPKLQFIYARRSVRKYLDKEIPEAMLIDLLTAGMAAPSAVARDPWHFVVVRQQETLDQLAAILPNGRMLKQAGAALVVSGDITRAHDQQESYLLQDVSAAVENILLAATALGLGSCWLGVHPRQERMDSIRNLFKLPPEIIPVCGISLGWPAEELPARTRFNPERVHREAWYG
ncbi:MAG: nitroreductase family protein [Desulfobacterales bacterium]|nr:nitroreductase family protein [Desulfobacterales bacterium]